MIIPYIATAENGPYFFTNFTNTLFDLLVTQTTSNYPDIMMPIYEKYRFASVFFISFCVINSLLLSNILISFYYYNYKSIILEEIESSMKRKERLIKLSVICLLNSNSMYSRFARKSFKRPNIIHVLSASVGKNIDRKNRYPLLKYPFMNKQPKVK